MGYPTVLSMLWQLALFSVMLSLQSSSTAAKTSIADCLCGALNTRYDYRFGCRCFRKQPLTDRSVFPASSLPVNLTSLFLGVPDQSWEEFQSPYCQASNSSYSYLSSDTMRLWEGTSLQYISFSNFDFNKGRVKRISPWLENVKGTLTEMEIICGKLKTLSTGVFVGFAKLRKLTITGTYLEGIESGAFAELNTGTESVLTELNLSYNTIAWFNWAVMEPFASSLQSFSMRYTWLNSMQASLVPFPKLTRIILSNSYLPTISEAVLKTWPTSSGLGVTLDSNPFCPSDSLCRCCSLLPMLRFANQTGAWISVSCGNKEKEEYLNETAFPSASQSPFCTDKYNTYITSGRLLTIINISLCGRCDADEDPSAMLCTNVRPEKSSGNSDTIQSRENHRFVTCVALLLILANYLLSSLPL